MNKNNHLGLKIKSKAKEDENLNFIEHYSNYALFALVGVIFLFALISYMFTQYPIKFNPDFGAIGDFIGGLLNPVFALLGLFALLKTINIQTKELKTSSEALKNSHQELSLTREESRRSREAIEEQSKSIKLQNFENTFFKMINLHHEITKSLRIEANTNIDIDSKISGHIIKYNFLYNKEYNSKQVIAILGEKLWHYLIALNTLPNYKENTNTDSDDRNQMYRTNELYLLFHYEHQEYYGHYFRNIYQILKFISNSEINNPKFYSNILRAQMSRLELELLFYNCASDIGSEKFLPLLIEFEFMEHFPHDTSINRKDIAFYMKQTLRLKKEYSHYRVFGKSESWKNETDDVVTEILNAYNNA